MEFLEVSRSFLNKLMQKVKNMSGAKDAIEHLKN